MPEEEDDDDYPHPIGFSRYGLLDVRSSNDDAKESIVYDNNDDELLWNHDENQNSGPSGYSGVSGYSGASGYSGISGFSGYSGCDPGAGADA